MYNTISTPGGKAWKHACSLRLRFKKDTLLDMNNNELSSRAENPAGNKVAIEITKTKVCKPDRRLGYYTLNYTNGVDYVNDTITLAIQYGFIKRSGGWFSICDENKEVIIVDDKELKLQGMGRLNQYLKDNKDVFDKLYQLVNKEMM